MSGHLILEMKETTDTLYYIWYSCFTMKLWVKNSEQLGLHIC